MNTTTKAIRRAVPVVALALAAATAGAGAAATASPAHDRANENRARGLVHTGLVWAEEGPCAGGWRADVPGRNDICTHGPDSAPAGTDVTSVAYDLASFATGPSATAGSSAAPCIGDGVSGPRVQAIYAVASDRVDYYDMFLPKITDLAGQMDATVNASAAATGGERHIRFVTNADCSLNVAKVVLSPTGDDTFSNMVTELRALGFDATDRKYLVWADALVYCGIAQIYGDDSPGATNRSNSGPTYARVDKSCWGLSDHLAELHELMHTLGSVQRSAPHASEVFHCTDESDAMCYSDAAGVAMTYPCPAEDEWLLDCGHDDYFNTNPPAGSYLDTHWNTADSVFLATSLTDTGPTVDPVSPQPEEQPQVTTTTFTGSVSAKQPSDTFSLTVGQGEAAAALSFTAKGRKGGSPTMSLRAVGSDGSVVMSGTGPSVLNRVAALQAGTYSFTVSGSTNIFFTLDVTHPQA